jgi:Ser/Thr protein kinase RdoA (MazF antagonist)
MTEQEEPLYGGLEDARVFRVGSTVRRPAGAWTPTVQALLAHLQTKGFPAPKPLGLDGKGREIVSYLPGRAGLWPWPEALRVTSGARDVGVLLRRYHDAVADFAPPAPPVWQHGEQTFAPGEIALHGDFAPHNLLWEGASLSGVIDFELARPGMPIDDAVFCVIRVAHLRPDSLARNLGYVEVPDRCARLDAFAKGYGCAVDELLAHTIEGQRAELDRMLCYGTAGMEPWAGFLRRGLEPRAREDLAWLKDNIGQ